MKKLPILFIFISSFFLCQEFVLTPENFKNKDDLEKDYVVIEMPETSREQLFKKVKKFVNSFYNNPKYISSEVENEQLVIDAVGKEFLTIYQMSGANLWRMNYKYEINFKDNKLMFKPFFKKLENTLNFKEIYLIGMGGGSIMSTGMFNKKGTVSKEKGKLAVEYDVNSFIVSLKNSLNKQENASW